MCASVLRVDVEQPGAVVKLVSVWRWRIALSCEFSPVIHCVKGKRIFIKAFCVHSMTKILRFQRKPLNYYGKLTTFQREIYVNGCKNWFRTLSYVNLRKVIQLLLPIEKRKTMVTTDASIQTCFMSISWSCPTRYESNAMRYTIFHVVYVKLRRNCVNPTSRKPIATK